MCLNMGMLLVNFCHCRHMVVFECEPVVPRLQGVPGTALQSCSNFGMSSRSLCQLAMQLDANKICPSFAYRSNVGVYCCTVLLYRSWEVAYIPVLAHKIPLQCERSSSFARLPLETCCLTCTTRSLISYALQSDTTGRRVRHLLFGQMHNSCLVYKRRVSVCAAVRFRGKAV